MDIAGQVRARAAEMLEDSGAASAPVEVDSRRVRNCLGNNERGDGVLFAELNAGKYLYLYNSANLGEWYRWTGIVWQYDEAREVVRTGVEEVAVRYENEIVAVRGLPAPEGEDEEAKEKAKNARKGLIKDLRQRVDRCRSKAGAEKILYWAPIVAPEMACNEAERDQKPMLLPCANGVINLETGALQAGRPQDLLTRAIDVAYDPAADTSPCRDFLSSILGGNEDEVEFVQRSLGVALTGHSHEQYFWLLIGDGRNGKGVLMHILAALLGPYYHEINAAMLVARRSPPNPGATSEHIMSLQGKRLISAGETNDHERIDAREFKRLTGDNILNGRANYAKEVTFRPTHCTWLQTNHVPQGITGDFAMLQRLLILDFPYSFVDDPEDEARRYPARSGFFRKKDPELKSRMTSPEMLQKWLRFAVEGCRKWRNDGLKIPPSVIARRDELARQADFFNDFFADCVEKTTEADKMRCVDMYAVFQRWYAAYMGDSEENASSRIKYPAMKTMNNAFRKRGYEVAKNGVYYIIAVRIKKDCPYQWASEADRQYAERWG